MTKVTVGEVLAQAEKLTLEEQLTLLARLAERIRVVYSQQLAQSKKCTTDEQPTQDD